MKKAIRNGAKLFICGCLFFGIQYGACAEPRVGIVNVDQLFEKYEKTVQFNAQLEKDVSAKQSERDAKVEDVRRMKDELVLLTDENKRKKQDDIDEKIRDLQKFDEKTRDELSGKRDDYMKQILVELDDKVKAYGEKNGYDYILNGRLVLYEKESKYDITDKLIEEVNKDYAK